MGAAAKKAAGSKFQIDVASTWTDIGEVIGVTISGPQGDDIEVTTLDSLVDKQFIAGLVDGGEAQVALNLEEDMTTQQALTDNLRAGGPSTGFRFVQGSNAKVLEATGYVKGFATSAQTGGKVEATATVKYDGFTPMGFPQVAPGP